MLLFALTETVDMLYAARIIQSIAAAFIGITVQTIVADLATVDRRGTEMSKIDEIQVRGEMVDILIGIVVFSVLDDRGVGWRLLFMIYAAICGYAAWTAWRAVPETRSTNDLENNVAFLKEHPEIQSDTLLSKSFVAPSQSAGPHTFEPIIRKVIVNPTSFSGENASSQNLSDKHLDQRWSKLF